MKLLALSDFHGDYSHVPTIIDLAGNFDAVLLAGDITDFGPDERALDLLKMFNVPVLVIPGNCDNPSILQCLDDNAICIHNSYRIMEGISFLGIGGSNPTPFNTPFELSEKRIGENVGKLLSRLRGKIVLLSHAPPLNTTDRVQRGNVGSAALARYLGRFDLVVCGHIHEARGIVKVNGTLIVNPGTATKGEGALITINEGISVDFIDA